MITYVELFHMCSGRSALATRNTSLDPMNTIRAQTRQSKLIVQTDRTPVALPMNAAPSTKDDALAKEVVRGAVDKATSGQTDAPIISPEALRVAGIAGSLLAVMDLNDTMVFPFLADFFLQRDVSQGAVGGAFAALSIGMLLFAIAMPKLMPLVGGPSRTLGVGLFLFGGIRFVCAALPLVGTGTPLLAVSLVVFFLQGCIYAFSEVGALTWVLYITPQGEKVPAVAALAGSRVLGGMLGTPLGGVLFDLIGWAPTNIVGGLLLVIPPFFFWKDVTKRIENMEKKMGSGKTWTHGIQTHAATALET